MDAQVDNLDKVVIEFDDRDTIPLYPEDGELFAYKPGVKVELDQMGKFMNAPMSDMTGRYIALRLDNRKLAPKLLQQINDHSKDEIKEISLFYDDDRTRVLSSILEYQHQNDGENTYILLRAAK